MAVMLTDLEVIAMRRAHCDGVPQWEIAERFKVSRAAVSEAVRGRSHRDVVDRGQRVPAGRVGARRKRKATWSPTWEAEFQRGRQAR
jgi:hypothetical protein